MKKLVILLLVLSVCWFAQVAPSYAKIEGRSLPAAHLNKASADYMTRTLVNIGNVGMWIFADGTSANQPNGNSGLFFPRGSTPSTAVIFQDGFIMGGVVNDGIEPAIRIEGQAYDTGTVPGAILSKGVAEDQNDYAKVNRIWRVRKDFATLTDDDLRLDAAEVNSVNAADVTAGQIAGLRAAYKADWLDWPVYKGAPFYDAEGDGLYNPKFNADGTPVLYPDGDEPGYANGDQVVWLIVNDLDPSACSNFYGSVPTGLELQITLWAYKRADAMGNIIFKQFRAIYKGRAETPANATISDMYVCQWADPDNGEAGDDFAGCDTTLSLGYVYNASASDPTFSAAGYPPAAGGYDFFAGPMVPSDDPASEGIFGLKKRPGYKNLPMTSFAFFAAGQTDSDPDQRVYNGTMQWWNLLRGYKPRPQYPEGTPWTDPQTGATTMFRVPGDPVTGTGWIDENTGDRRILMVSGPTEIALGDTVETVVAVAGAMGSDRLSSVSVLKFYDRFAQNAFDVLFELPSAPPKPTMLGTELNQQVLLNWAVDPVAVAKVEGFNDKGYAFEGYNLYQLPNAGATAAQGVKLATYDLKNGVTTVVQESFDAASGLVLSLPAQIGKDTGIKRTLTVTTDRLRDAPLANGRMYYFGISAYSYNGTPGLTTVTLESPMTVVSVVPQSTKPGVRLTTENSTMLEVNHAEGTSEGVVTAEVIDNTRLSGHEYKVSFRDVDGNSVWDLTDVTTGTVKLSGQVNQSGDDDYLIVDGVQVKVTGPTTAGLKDNGYNYVPSGNRFLTAFNDAAAAATLWPMEGWAGLFGWANNFFGTGLPATGCKNVEIRFAACDELGNPLDPNDPNASMAYRYMRRASAPAADPAFAPFIVNPAGGYAYQDMRLVCFAAYDMEANPPRRLNVGFNENNAAGGLVNGVWMPGRYDTQGGMNTTREFMFIFASDYSTTPQALYTDNDMLNTVTNTDLMYVGVPSRRGARLPQAGDKVILEANHFNTPADVFTFSTVAPTNLMADAVNDIAKINVFPNPYYGFNIVEKNQFSRFVTFSHLPAKATIRVFTLAGVLVRTLEKNDPAQFTTWDLQNEAGLPVASGVYLVHIDLPEVGKTKTLKLALVREQQFLTIY